MTRTTRIRLLNILITVLVAAPAAGVTAALVMGSELGLFMSLVPIAILAPAIIVRWDEQVRERNRVLPPRIKPIESWYDYASGARVYAVRGEIGEGVPLLEHEKLRDDMERVLLSHSTDAGSNSQDIRWTRRIDDENVIHVLAELRPSGDSK